MEILQKTLEQFLAFIPRLTGALIISAIGFVLAKVLSTVVEKILVAIKIDKFGEKINDIEAFQGIGLQIKISNFCSKLIYYIVILVALVAASDALQMQVISVQLAKIVEYIPKLISALVVVMIGALIANFVKELVAKTLTSLRIAAANLLGSLVFYILFITIAISGLAQAEINTDFLTANLSIILGGVVAAFALSFGIAARTTMANLLGMVYSNSKFRIGDTIRIGEVKGQIVAIDANSMTLQTEASHTIIPMAKLAEEMVERF
jgi:Ca2+/Na+ antiporter